MDREAGGEGAFGKICKVIKLRRVLMGSRAGGQDPNLITIAQA
jgi:hypothetical protein